MRIEHVGRDDARTHDRPRAAAIETDPPRRPEPDHAALADELEPPQVHEEFVDDGDGSMLLRHLRGRPED